MEANRPFVSIIMPAYNSERYIEEAIHSIQSQTFDNFELIVVDDCSSDSTCDIVEQMAQSDKRISLLRNEKNSGTACSRNRALDSCRGDYIAFLDSDDVWHPDKLASQIERLRSESADIAYSSYAIIDVSGNKVKADYIVPDRVGYKQLQKENFIGCSTVMLTKAIAEKYRFISGFHHEDYVMWLQMLRDGYKAAGCREVLVSWRYVEDSRSFNKWNAAKSRWRIYRKCLGLPLAKSAVLIINYAIAGLKKYK